MDKATSDCLLRKSVTVMSKVCRAVGQPHCLSTGPFLVWCTQTLLHGGGCFNSVGACGQATGSCMHHMRHSAFMYEPLSCALLEQPCALLEQPCVRRHPHLSAVAWLGRHAALCVNCVAAMTAAEYCAYRLMLCLQFCRSCLIVTQQIDNKPDKAMWLMPV